MGLRVFASCSTYALGKALGIEAAAREFQRQCLQPDRGSLPSARMVARLRLLADVQLFHVASTSLPKLRSRSAHAALSSGADLWIQLDDDVETDTATLERLLDVAGTGALLRAVSVPCRVRGTVAESYRLDSVFDGVLTTVCGAALSTVRPLLRGGMGCFVTTRAALQQVCEHFPELGFVDDDQQRKLALFEMLREPGGQWLGEDYSFCERLRTAGVELLALLNGCSTHEGAPLLLDNIR